MGGATTRIPMSRRVLSPTYKLSDENSGDDHPAMQLSGSIFGFLEEEATALSSPSNHEIDDEEEEHKKSENDEFWATQNQNLHTALFRTTSLESNVRKITKEVVGEVEVAENVCSCWRPVSSGCRSCRMKEICRRLQNSGYNSGICRSKWRSSSDIPSGEHTFIDVIDDSNTKKGEVKVIIDLEFRGQFAMKKANDGYNRLVAKLPDVFVGKIERLLAVVKILSTTAKKCMKEKKMHLGPWRKQEYMKAKWVRVTDRTTMALTEPWFVDGCSVRPARPRASMLTMDLLDHFHGESSLDVLCK